MATAASGIFVTALRRAGHEILIHSNKPYVFDSLDDNSLFKSRYYNWPKNVAAGRQSIAETRGLTHIATAKPLICEHASRIETAATVKNHPFRSTMKAIAFSVPGIGIGAS